MCSTTSAGQAGNSTQVRKVPQNAPQGPPEPQTSQPPPNPAPAPNPSPAGPSLAPDLVAAATAFKAVFNDNGASYHLTNGQFAVYSQFQTDLIARIFDINDTALQVELLNLARDTAWDNLSDALRTPADQIRITPAYQNSLPASDPDAKGNKPIGALRSNSIVNNLKAYKNNIAKALQLMNAGSVSAADQSIASDILTETSGTGEWAAHVINGWFVSPKIGPITFDKVSLPRMCALFIFSLVGCGSTSQYTGKKLLGTSGTSPASLPVFNPVTLTSLGQKDSRSTPGNLILKYNSSQLTAAISSAKSLLAAGGYLVAGCLSGKDHESYHPRIEHYILIFAASDMEFLFWDPDSIVTNIAAYSSVLGPAIGILTFDDTDSSAMTYSTGADFNDLSSVRPQDGNHKQNPIRHRYQIMTLAKP